MTYRENDACRYMADVYLQQPLSFFIISGMKPLFLACLVLLKRAAAVVQKDCTACLPACLLPGALLFNYSSPVSNRARKPFGADPCLHAVNLN